MQSAPLLLALTGALVPLAAPGPTAPGVWRMSESDVLGTEATFAVVADREDAAQSAIAAARAEIERLDGLFNWRRPNSALSALNRGQTSALPVELQTVIDRADHWRRMSGGAFEPRIGRQLAAWRGSSPDAPYCLDGIAKGYIVDCALEAGLKAANVRGLLVDIGGEMRASGQGPEAGGWTVEIADPHLPYLNAPPAARLALKDKAIATSGRGARDFEVGGQRVSSTLDPATGRPATQNLCATVLADNTMDADALASALLVLPADQGLALAERTPGAEARITDAAGAVFRTTGWKELAAPAPRLVRVADTPGAGKWMPDWALELLYVAPNRQENRDPDFRSPYMALWISDKAGNPIRTVMLVGGDPKYQKENYVWWKANQSTAPKLVELRSGATSLSGRYSLFWPGYDDGYKFVAQGEYVLHVETSQEHGKHTYRSMPLVLGPKPFTTTMPVTKEGGGLNITYGKRE